MALSARSIAAYPTFMGLIETMESKRATTRRVSTMTITLTTEIEKALVEQAKQIGSSPEALALETLRERFAPRHAGKDNPTAQSTLAEFLGDQLGALSSGEYVAGGARMSEDTGKRFAAGMLEKQRQGRL